MDRSGWRIIGVLGAIFIGFLILQYMVGGIVHDPWEEHRTKPTTAVATVPPEVPVIPQPELPTKIGLSGRTDLSEFPVATSRKNYEECFSATQNRDWDKLTQLMLTGKIFMVPYGTDVKILESASTNIDDKNYILFNVRILHGDHAGESVWLSKELVMNP